MRPGRWRRRSPRPRLWRILSSSLSPSSASRCYGPGGFQTQSGVSSGMSGFPTPTGVFSVIQKNRYHRSNIYSGAPMPFMQRITWSGVALHAGVLPGYPASHGCIRLTHSFASELWGMTRMGARVVVAPEDVQAVEFAHPALPVPTLTPAPVADAESAKPSAVVPVSTADKPAASRRRQRPESSSIRWSGPRPPGCRSSPRRRPRRSKPGKRSRLRRRERRRPTRRSPRCGTPMPRLPAPRPRSMPPSRRSRPPRRPRRSSAPSRRRPPLRPSSRSSSKSLPMQLPPRPPRPRKRSPRRARPGMRRRRATRPRPSFARASATPSPSRCSSARRRVASTSARPGCRSTRRR